MRTNMNAHLAYGTQIPRECLPGIDDKLREVCGREGAEVRHLTVGPPEGGDLFLVTKTWQAEAGSPSPVKLSLYWTTDYLRWDRQIEEARTALGLAGDFNAGWILIADHG